jgi:hypothetical protein
VVSQIVARSLRQCQLLKENQVSALREMFGRQTRQDLARFFSVSLCLKKTGTCDFLNFNRFWLILHHWHIRFCFLNDFGEI